MKHLSLLLIALAAFAPLVCLAKRAAPKKVDPVFTSTLRIEAPLDDGRIARVHAFDTATGRLVWTVVVFKNKINPRLEEDVQWHFITKLTLIGDTIEVTAEDGARYRLNLSTREVRRVLPKPGQTAELQTLEPTTPSPFHPRG